MRKTRRIVAAIGAAIALVGGMALFAPSATATVVVAPPIGGQGSEAMVGGSADAFANAAGTQFDHVDVRIAPNPMTNYSMTGWDAVGNQVYTNSATNGLPVGTTTLPNAFPDNTFKHLPDGIVRLNVQWSNEAEAVDTNHTFLLSDVVPTPGPAGPAGPAGPQGIQGLAGPAGADGTNGTNGLPGDIGPAGAPGTNGTNGVDGAVGPQGPAGTSFTQQPTTFTDPSGTVVAFPNAAGTQFDHVVVTPTADMPMYGLQGYDATGMVPYSAISAPADANGTGAPGAPLAANVATTLPNAELAALPDTTWTIPLPDGVIGLTVWFTTDSYSVGFDHTFWLNGAPGPKGDTGAVGPQGPAGADGAVGPAGAVGAQGLPGAAGVVGPAGAKGDTGSQGADGAVGPKGDTGAAGANGLDGAIGPQGLQGLIGVAGANGATGDIGPVGPKGDTGATGAQGEQGLPGAKGDNGLPGAAGAKGDTGAVGPAGATGAVGPAGAQGAKGDPGQDSTIAGPTGATGATGPAGPSVGATVMINPVRIADSRINFGFPTFTTAGTSNLPIAGSGIPATGVAGVILNVTTTNAQFGGYLTMFPAGSPQPGTSTNNFQPGVNVPNGVTVKVGANNTISIFATGHVDVVVDVMGYVTG